MRFAERIKTLAINSLEKLGCPSGYQYSIMPDGTIQKEVLARYNARVALSVDIKEINAIGISCLKNLQRKDGRFYYASEKSKLGHCADVAIAVTALKKHGANVDNSIKYLKTMINNGEYKESIEHVEQIPWIVDAVEDRTIMKRLLQTNLIEKHWGLIPYISFPAIIYSIHSLVRLGWIAKAVGWADFLIKKMQEPEGAWRLAYFPSLGVALKRDYSVHQFGMAPLYLSELYELVKKENLIDAAVKGVTYGQKFVRRGRILRSLRPRETETRSYECAFDYAGMKKLEEYL